MIYPKKSLGQNFLVDANTARKIAGALRAVPDDPVVEIGPGVGALTGLLADRHPHLVAIEIDDRAVAELRIILPTVDIRHADVLDVKWEQLANELGGPVHVIGNLPYNITSPILFSMIAEAGFVREAVVTMQLEVAQRLVAVPRTKSYGILSVATQLASRPELLFRISRNVFRPRPAVTSAVVRLDFHGGLSEVPYDGLIREVVRSAFNQRRKILSNSLSQVADAQGSLIPERWASKRAEELSPQEFVELARYLGG